MNFDERTAVAEQFGVATEQVERDHLISHLLAVLSREFGDRIHFIGGTALARTHLPNGRLSEDIDLVAIGDRKPIATDMDAVLPRALARSHGRLTLAPALSSIPDIDPAIIRTSGGLTVRLQLLSSRDRIVWPTERRSLVQRYADTPAAELLVPTLPAFAASKTATWVDRHASRDLWDLWALNRLGAIDAAAEDLYRRYGPTNQPPAPRDFAWAPSEAEWQSQLSGQTRLTVSPEDSLRAVRDAWAQVSGSHKR
ncbi:nucleotidyl transferase AbiEii/AbiGii toxin family protein [Mycolicibacterium sphagni]|uniref:Nucleotidyl transferase AbiEii/AbiGii toxin family protein n=1 Tax=Mycolicibacterium sphagni TaxID=1786 RepID=A0ABX2K062_9MYCO|nr:nucleotidyl transferase AbiEii/AbiGii toxin family protein [Mycolicibacterium sphagni]